MRIQKQNFLLIVAVALGLGALGDAQAVTCPGRNGPYYTDVDGSCVVVPTGYYGTMDFEDSNSCMPTFNTPWCCNINGSTNYIYSSITICPMGYFCSGAGSFCNIAKCPVGSTTSGEGASAASDCNVCLEGFTWNGSKCVLNCPAGQAPNSAGTACEACAVGSWKSATDGSACTACETNQTTVSTGSTSDSACVCKPGYRLNGTTCTACSTGTYKSDASNDTTCTSCGGHKTTSGSGKTSAADCSSCVTGYTGTACTTCAAGYGGNGTTCTACTSGTYKASSGNTSCGTCPTGQTPNKTSAATSCTCAAGYTGSNCTACAQGTWKSGTGTGACTSCGPNMTTDSTGATSKDACKCVAGYVLENGVCVEKTGPDPCADGYTELHTANDLVFKAWAEQTTEHAIVLQRAGSDTKCYVNLASGPAAGAINVKIGETIYHTTD